MPAIVLDTNVISKLVRGSAADRRVLTWVRSRSTRPVTTAVNRAEVMSGIATMPSGVRRDRLREESVIAFAELGEPLPLTGVSADRYAEVILDRRRIGRPIGNMDALVAAICLEHDAQLATRDLDGFAGLGLDLVDPWND